MDVQAVTSIITTVGFPIAVCFIFFCYIYMMQEQHQSEKDKLAEALYNNTLVIQKLINNLENKRGTT